RRRGQGGRWPGWAEGRDCEDRRELEAVLGVVGPDFHRSIMGPDRPVPTRHGQDAKGRPEAAPASRGRDGPAQRESSSRVEDTQPLLPSSSSTSHIIPCFSPVGYSIMPTSSERTTPLPSGPVNRRAGLVTVTAWWALAAEA